MKLPFRRNKSHQEPTPLQEEGQNDKRFNALLAVYTGVGAVIILGITIGSSLSDIDKEDKRNNIEKALQAIAPKEGFEAVSLALNQDISILRDQLTIDLGGCSLSGVDYSVERDDAGRVVDANYAFNGIAYPEFTSEGSGGPNNRQVDAVAGVAVTFEFDDYTGLQEVLGPKPCLTLANNITREGTN